MPFNVVLMLQIICVYPQDSYCNDEGLSTSLIIRWLPVSDLSACIGLFASGLLSSQSYRLADTVVLWNSICMQSKSSPWLAVLLYLNLSASFRPALASFVWLSLEINFTLVRHSREAMTLDSARLISSTTCSYQLACSCYDKLLNEPSNSIQRDIVLWIIRKTMLFIRLWLL